MLCKGAETHFAAFLSGAVLVVGLVVLLGSSKPVTVGSVLMTLVVGFSAAQVADSLALLTASGDEGECVELPNAFQEPRLGALEHAYAYLPQSVERAMRAAESYLIR